MAVVSVGEELKCAPTGTALEVMFHNVTGPRGIEYVLERASAFSDDESTVLDSIKQPESEFEILARPVEAEAIHEPVALRTCRHCLSVPPSRLSRSDAEGVWVMVP